MTVASSIVTGSISFGVGAIANGTLPAVTDRLLHSAAGMLLDQFLPKLSINLGNNFTLSFNMSVMLGHSYGFGLNASLVYDDGNFSFAAGYGITKFTNYNGLGINGWEHRFSGLFGYGGKDFKMSLGTNVWKGLKGLEGESLNQRTGIMRIQSGDFGMTYENDGAPFGGWAGDNGDKYRSAALSMSIGDYSVGFNIFTGYRDWQNEDEATYEKGFFNRLFKKTPIGTDGGFGANLPYGLPLEKEPKYRFASLYAGYKGLRLGIESYRYVGHPIQNIGAHHLAKPQAGFPSLDNKINSYFQYQTLNPFTLW